MTSRDDAYMLPIGPVDRPLSWKCAACGFQWKRYEEHARDCPHALPMTARRQQRAVAWRAANEEALGDSHG